MFLIIWHEPSAIEVILDNDPFSKPNPIFFNNPSQLFVFLLDAWPAIDVVHGVFRVLLVDEPDESKPFIVSSAPKQQNPQWKITRYNHEHWTITRELSNGQIIRCKLVLNNWQ